MKKIILGIASIFVIFSGFLMTPTDLVYADGASSGDLAANGPGQTGIEGALGSCNLIEQFSICVLSFLYNVILTPSFYIVALGANILDYFLGFTINSNSYRAEFITKGWGLIRDISNIAFIFTLLYLAIRHILGLSSKKYIPTLIIVALLLNFSLFFTKVIIDGGNILSRAFYESINTPNDSYSDSSGYRGISSALVSKINPQQILSESLFAVKLQPTEFSTSTGTTNTTPTQQNLKEAFGYFAMIFILLTVVNIMMAWIFISVALLFVGRTIGLWFAMIFSPIAFVTLAVPNSGGFVKKLSFDTWKDTTLKLAFVAPIFIFFLYLTITFLNLIFSTQVPTEGRDTFMILMNVIVPFVFVLVLLRTAKSTAEDMAGEMGGAVKTLVGKIGGFVGGAALGATAFAGRRVIGAAAGRNLTLGNYQQRIQQAEEAGDTATARRLTRKMETMKKIYSSSFDIRNAGEAKGVAGWVSRKVGAGLNAGMTGFAGDKFTLGKGDKESRKKYIDDIKKERLDLAHDLGSIGENEDSQVRMRELRRQRANAQITRRELVRTGQNTQAIDADITRYTTDMQRIQGAHAEITQTRRNLFANRLEDSRWESLISGIENTELHADEIRQGNRSRSAEQRALDAIRALNPPPPPNTPPPPPNTPPPNTPPPNIP